LHDADREGSMHRTRSALVSTFLAVALVSLAAPGVIAAITQHRVTHFGPDGDLTKQASFPDVAFNSKSGRYLVVYMAGSDTNDDHWAIYGQRVSATGTAVGGRIRISSPTDRFLCSYEPPSVRYARNINQFLVTWDGGSATDCDDAIYVRRISGAGRPLGAHDTRVSDRGYGDIETSLAAYNPQRKEWLVAWNAEGPDELGGIQELWGQRLSATGSQVGANDRRLTDHATDNFDGDDAIGLAYDPDHHRYLVAVRGVDSTVVGDEVFGHLMDSRGKPIGEPQFRISHVTDTNPSGDALPPRVIYDHARHRFLVVWTGNPQVGSMDASEIDIFGRFVKPDGSLVGNADKRLSNVGVDGDASFVPTRPDIGFNPFLDQFLLAWAGDNDKSGGVDQESEVWGQRVAGNGDPVGALDFRISHSGPDGSINFAANRPAIAFDPSNCRYLIVWSSGKVGSLGGANQEWEIFDNLVSSRCPRD
jgi:hypothetical protein